MTDAALVERGAEQHGHSHRDVNGGWLRPAVFGAMDGLVSNLALIAGVAAAAGVNTHVVVVTGIAGLLAGAFSMAVGEWTSVHSQAELVRSEIAKERRELVRRPAAEQAELAALFAARGVPRELAKKVAHELSQDPELVWRIHVREELGVDPDNLASPYVAAFSSLMSFAVGAFLPLLPYLVGSHQLWPALAVAAVALSLLGASVARFTDRPWWLGASRQLVLGAAAAAITYGVGSAFGVGLS
ncbi:MAG TPA: VIT1/CCC1 transporter family protein [Mycobacteriales bacterium]|jgi:VIT1/CCC1 family predicted Fe2+/Mn2+ transporter|nr:VIT1/CCC1 transporter family protein [Mycobacteriales bacterium]